MNRQLSIALNNRRLHWFYCLLHWLQKQQSSRVSDDDGDDGKYDDNGGGDDYRSEGDDEYDTNAKNNILCFG